MTPYLVELLLIVFLLFLFAISWRAPTAHQDQKLLEVSSNLENISKKLQVDVKHQIHPSRDKTYVRNKKDIYLVTHDKNGRLFDNNTINRAAIHELAHIMCPGHGHGPIFKSIEENLLKVGVEMKICDPSKKINASYPCLENDDSQN